MKDSPQNIESTRVHFQHILELRRYTPCSTDESLSKQLQLDTTQVHHDWIWSYPSSVWEGEDGNRSYTASYQDVRHRTYGLTRQACTTRVVVATQLLYYSVPAASERFHHVRMVVDPDDDTRRNLHNMQLLHFVFGTKLNEEDIVQPNIVQIQLLNLRDTWCGYGVLETRDSQRHDVFWRRIPRHAERAVNDALRVDFDYTGSCACDIPFAYAIHIATPAAILLLRVIPVTTMMRVTRDETTFTVTSETKSWTFGSLLHYYEEPKNARLVLDPFFASPFSQWLMFLLNHCLRWRLDHDNRGTTQAFIDSFFAVTKQWRGDELQYKLQEKFPLGDLGDVSSVPLVATNPPFFFRQSMFEHLFKAQDVVVLCSETKRTSSIMHALDIRYLDAPSPSKQFVFYNNGTLAASYPRATLRFWVRRGNEPVRSQHVRLKFDPLLNELLLEAIRLDELLDETVPGNKKKAQKANPSPSPDNGEVESKRRLVDSMISDQTKAKRIRKMAALYFVRLVPPDVVAAYTTGPFWREVQDFAAFYWNAIDSVRATYPRLVNTHFHILKTQAESLRTRSLLFFSLAAPHVHALEESIQSPDQVDKECYDPLHTWYSSLETINNWLSETLSEEDKRDLIAGLAKLQTI